MPQHECGEEHGDTMIPRCTIPETYLVPMVKGSTTAQGPRTLPPVPTAPNGCYDDECMYEEMPDC